AGLLRQLVQRRRQAQLLERLDVLRNLAERGAKRLALEIHVDTEARDAGDVVREVDLLLDLESFLLLGAQNAVEERLRRLRVERRGTVERLELASNAHDRR